MIAFLFLALTAHAGYKIVPENQTIERLWASPNHNLSTHIRLLSWNVHKGTAGQAWADDFTELAVDKELVLVQEGVQDDFMPFVLGLTPSLGWLMAKSFYMEDEKEATGVITGAILEPSEAFFLRSRDTEPIISTPKMSLATVYKMDNGKSLLVINIHAINFTLLRPFKNQINDIADMIKTWDGKVIFAGDFNTWNPGRTAFLTKTLKAIGLKEVTFKDRRGLIIFDRIFLRGCVALAQKVHYEVQSSDHAPLSAELDCH